MDAFLNGPKEKLLYMPCVSQTGSDYIATIDSDPESPTYSQVIHRLKVTPDGTSDELHHTGWNACSSCHGDPTRSRRYLIAPGLKTSNIYIIDTFTDPRAPKLHKVVKGDDIKAKTNLSYPHTAHCLADGNLMISMMGDKHGNATGGFLLLDENFEIKGRWENEPTPYGYDFWYQPKHNIMVSSEWGEPNTFDKGFDPSLVPTKYGNSLHFWNWKERKVEASQSLGEYGMIPLEVRFQHNPDSTHGFCGAALSSNVLHFWKADDGKWHITPAIQQDWDKVDGWALPEMPPLITDILISLDDKYLYFSNWLRGDICQYDISDPMVPKLVGKIDLGGSAQKGGPVTLLEGEAKEPVFIKGKRLRGGPQMIQLSLDGKRLYATNSLYSSWDSQFYPEMVEKGSQLIQVDVDTENGGMTLNKEFLVDFLEEPWGPVLAHEVRYPGGDCTSDIWI